MTFELQQVVPWGRSFPEYVRMFALSENELKTRRILGCADGPAAFNAVATRHHCRVVSCDPLYQLPRDEIRRRIDETFEIIMEQTRANAEGFVWGRGIDSPEALGAVRMRAMEEFLEDYEPGLDEERYRAMELPRLDFADGAFDLALCSHFLFLYSEQLGVQFHIDAVLELLRVAAEVRVFPLLDLGGEASEHVDAVMDAVREKGFDAAIAPVAYEFQKGGKWMLRIRKRAEMME